MCQNEQRELTVDDCTRMVEEVWDLVDVQHPLEALGAYNHLDQFDTSKLNARLQELLDDITNHSSDELAAYLRYSNNWKEALSVWQPLLDAAYAQARTRNEPQIANQMFVGLIPKTEREDS